MVILMIISIRMKIKEKGKKQEKWVGSLSQKDPLEVTHSSILDWRISWTERSLEGYSPKGHKRSDMTEVTEHACPRQELIGEK